MIFNLYQGNYVANSRALNNTQIQNWKFKNECASIGGGIIAGVRFQILDVNKIPGNMWVKVLIPNMDPPQILKISGEEFANNFKLVI